MVEQLEHIAGRANLWLRRWGIDEPIVIIAPYERKPPNLWGFDYWVEPSLFFCFRNAEIAAYSREVKAVRVALSDEFVIEGRIDGDGCWELRRWIPCKWLSIDFLLALKAFSVFFRPHLAAAATIGIDMILQQVILTFTKSDGYELVLRISPTQNEAVIESNGIALCKGDMNAVMLQLGKILCLTDL